MVGKVAEQKPYSQRMTAELVSLLHLTFPSPVRLKPLIIIFSG